MALLLKLLDAVLEILPEWLQRRWAKNDDLKNRFKEANRELREAIFSGDVDRITRARRNLDELQK